MYILYQSKHESIDNLSEKKRIKLEPLTTIKSRSLSSSPDPHSKPLFLDDSKEATKVKVEKVEDDSEATDIEETDAGEFALEMGLACVVCKQIDVFPNNKLIECQDCHSLYHQECHKPPATDQDINDPRFVWYCAKCTKTQKKITSKSSKQPPQKPSTMSASSAFQAAINLGKESAMQLVKAAKDKQEHTAAVIQPFKRAEVKASTSASPVSAQAKPIGLAGLAALNRSSSLNASSASSMSASSSSAANMGSGLGSGGTMGGLPQSSASSSSSSSNTTAPSSAVADKRLQLMKKKAAKANEKKRTGSK